MTESEYKALDKQQGSLINYIRKQQSVLYYVAHSPKEDCGFCVPRGVLVACNPTTLARLKTHAKRYYPSMTVIPMTNEQYYYHAMRCLGTVVIKEE